MLNVVSFVPFARQAREARKRDWSQQDLAEFYRVHTALQRAGMALTVDRGITDEGDPWYVFCREADEEPIIHFARIDEHYVVASAALGGVSRGFDLRKLIADILQREDIRRGMMHEAGKNATLWHPAALIGVVVGVAYFFSMQPVDAADAPSKGAGPSEAGSRLDATFRQAAMQSQPMGQADLGSHAVALNIQLAKLAAAALLAVNIDLSSSPPPSQQADGTAFEQPAGAVHAGAAAATQIALASADAPTSSAHPGQAGTTTDPDSALAAEAIRADEKLGAAAAQDATKAPAITHAGEFGGGSEADHAAAVATMAARAPRALSSDAPSRGEEKADAHVERAGAHVERASAGSDASHGPSADMTTAETTVARVSAAVDHPAPAAERVAPASAPTDIVGEIQPGDPIRYFTSRTENNGDVIEASERIQLTDIVTTEEFVDAMRYMYAQRLVVSSHYANHVYTIDLKQVDGVDDSSATVSLSYHDGSKIEIVGMSSQLHHLFEHIV